jgi:hypothetical protein
MIPGMEIGTSRTVHGDIRNAVFLIHDVLFSVLEERRKREQAVGA